MSSMGWGRSGGDPLLTSSYLPTDRSLYPMLSIEVELVLPLVCCISPPEYNTLCHFKHAQVALMDEDCYRFQTYVNRL